MKNRLALAAVLAFVAAAPRLSAQETVELPGATGRINVGFTEPADQGQAERLREVAARLKPVSDQLENLEEINIVVLHSARELELRLGPGHLGASSGASYLDGILFLSPLAWQRNPTDEAIDQEMSEALVRYTALHLAGGNRLPAWLEQGLVSVLTKRTFGATTGELIARRASLLLAETESDDPAVGYWAARYLLEARGGLGQVRQLLRMVAQRPDGFVENLQLVYGVPVGELERDWRRWLLQQVEEEKKREGTTRRGPLVKD
ncbi:MAG: hypothetical protein ACRD35_03215 [Candidatus Acidiferrales bacterium]